MKQTLIVSALAFSLLAGLSAFAGDSEMDGKAKKRPAVRIQFLDEKAETITTYDLATLDPEMTEEALDKLSKADRKAKVEAFLKKSATKANWVKTEPAVKKVGISEMDKDKSTAACGWGWRGGWGGGWRGGWGGGWGWNAGWGGGWAWSGGWGWGGCGGGWNVIYW